jgi:dihydroorotate dehydrogenase
MLSLSILKKRKSSWKKILKPDAAGLPTLEKCLRDGLQSPLLEEKSMKPLYDIEKSWSDNLNAGPLFSGSYPEREFPPPEEWIDFLGFKVASGLGIPAGPLLNSRWIGCAASLGFDILTYKTIRSASHSSHPLPNMIFIEPNIHERVALKRETAISSLEELSLTNSFGMPSKDPKYLIKDIARANSLLRKGQVMIVSVVGTHRKEVSFFDDFTAAALLAKEAGAQIIEANFSCPNVDPSMGELYTDPEIVYELGSKLVKAIHPIPLIIKVGLFSSKEQMQDTLTACARAGIRGFCGLNTINMKIIDRKGNPPLGPDRIRGGVCGAALRPIALGFIQSARTIIDSEKLPLALIGVGGITKPEHFDAFFNCGASIAMSATGMMWNPLLAANYRDSCKTITKR